MVVALANIVALAVEVVAAKLVVTKVAGAKVVTAKVTKVWWQQWQ